MRENCGAFGLPPMCCPHKRANLAAHDCGLDLISQIWRSALQVRCPCMVVVPQEFSLTCTNVPHIFAESCSKELQASTSGLLLLSFDAGVAPTLTHPLRETDTACSSRTVRASRRCCGQQHCPSSVCAEFANVWRCQTTPQLGYMKNGQRLVRATTSVEQLVAFMELMYSSTFSRRAQQGSCHITVAWLHRILVNHIIHIEATIWPPKRLHAEGDEELPKTTIGAAPFRQ